MWMDANSNLNKVNDYRAGQPAHTRGGRIINVKHVIDFLLSGFDSPAPHNNLMVVSGGVILSQDVTAFSFQP